MAKIGTVQKENNKHLILHLAVICLIFIGANIALTQRIAHLYGHHDALGPPLWGHYYLPWKWVVWASMYYETAKVAFDQAFVWVGVISALIFGTYAFIAAYAGMKGRAYKDLHGSAHFASKKEIRQTGLLAATSGVYVGAWEDKNKQVHYLRHDGPEHFLAFAPTRSGKGVGLVIPTLLSWPESVICLDIKGENWEMTSSWRKKHANNIVLKFDPTSSDGSAARFNPLDEIRLDTDMDVSDTQNIVEMLSIPDEKTGKEDPHFTPSGKAFLVGALLHFAYKAKREGEKISLPELTEQLSSLPFDELLDEMQHFPHRDGAVYGLVFQTAQDMLDRADRERSGVLSTAKRFLSLYRDPIVARNVATSDFTINDLMNNEKPVSLYLILRPSDKDRMKPLARLIVSQMIRRLTEQMGFREAKDYKHRLLLMFDEFASLGRLEIFQESLAYMASYGIKAYLIVQDLTQLYHAYGKDEGIISNCHIRSAYAPNKVETAELLSKMSGTTTVIKRTLSTSGKRFGIGSGRVSAAIQEVQRPLLTVDECMRLPAPRKDLDGKITEAGDMLIFSAGQPPIYGKQILYFNDPVFSARASLPAPEMSDTITMRNPTKETIANVDFKLEKLSYEDVEYDSE